MLTTDKFKTDRLRKILKKTTEKSEGKNWVGLEHLLLSICDESGSGSIFETTLRSFGVSVEQFKERLEKSI